MAREVLEMYQRINDLEHENAGLREYKDKYHELLNSILRSSEQMCFGLLKVGLKMAELEKKND